jgi:hypothetical protein
VAEFLHERKDFKALIDTVAESEKIDDPALVEKDYWIMHCLYGLLHNPGQSGQSSDLIADRVPK